MLDILHKLCYNDFIIKERGDENMTDEEIKIIKREILLAYIKLGESTWNKPNLRLSAAINIGLKKAEEKFNSERK
jgi:hypothetical protein